MKPASEKIKILWEDKDYAAVYKPAGLVVHPDGKTKEKALTHWIIKKYPKTKNVGESVTLSNGTLILRPGIVHRIDRDTSGVVVIAKNQIAYARLKKQFKRHEVRKIYHAFVYGMIKEKEGRIDRPIARSKGDFRRWTAERGARGESRDALTYYRVVKAMPEASFIEVRPQTGRTHQIRVHCKAIGHPVVADALYAPDYKSMFGFKRLALHASAIEFELSEGGRVRIEAPLPADFKAALAKAKIELPKRKPYDTVVRT